MAFRAIAVEGMVFIFDFAEMEAETEMEVEGAVDMYRLTQFGLFNCCPCNLFHVLSAPGHDLTIS